MAKGFSFASTFNKTSFGIDTTDFPFVKLSDIYNGEKDGGGDVEIGRASCRERV